MAHWIKFSFDRKEHVIDLDRISAFIYEPNGRLGFWLPGTVIPVTLTPQAHQEAHQKILDYLKDLTERAIDSCWVKIFYDRKDYWIDLRCLSTFCCDPNNRKITIWLPDCHEKIIIHPDTDPEDHGKILDYIQRITGYSLP